MDKRLIPDKEQIGFGKWIIYKGRYNATVETFCRGHRSYIWHTYISESTFPYYRISDQFFDTFSEAQDFLQCRGYL